MGRTGVRHHEISLSYTDLTETQLDLDGYLLDGLNGFLWALCLDFVADALRRALRLCDVHRKFKRCENKLIHKE